MKHALAALAALVCTLPLTACAATGMDLPGRPQDERKLPENSAPEPSGSPETSGNADAPEESDAPGMLVEPPPHESEDEMTRTPPVTGSEDEMVQVPPPVEPHSARPAPRAQPKEVQH